MCGICYILQNMRHYDSSVSQIYLRLNPSNFNWNPHLSARLKLVKNIQLLVYFKNSPNIRCFLHLMHYYIPFWHGKLYESELLWKVCENTPPKPLLHLVRPPKLLDLSWSPTEIIL